MSLSELSEDNCYVALTDNALDAKAIMDKVRSPKAGAIVLFAGTPLPSNLALINS
jgi:molybdopterin synthase catalytic subunit